MTLILIYTIEVALFSYEADNGLSLFQLHKDATTSNLA